MKTLLESMNIAFSMYSRIPMPRVDWNEKNMKFAMCFFPLVGLVIAVIQGIFLWNFRGFSSILTAAIATIIPILLTGAIHMDGLCDTIDALSSHQSQERKLEILKDSNAGAFAVIGCSVYILLSFALWESAISILQQNLPQLIVLMLGFALSRSLSGLSVVSFPCARNSGLAAMFAKSADKKKARMFLLLWLIGVMLAMLFVHLTTALCCFTAAFLMFAHYRLMSQKEFGGITGDLAGYFLQLCELLMLAAVLIGG